MTDRAFLKEFIEELGLPNLETVQMFGVPCIRALGGKPVISGYHGDMVFKLGADRVAQVMATSEDCTRFDPSGKGRPFKAWVQVPERAGLDWDALAREALAHG